MSTLDSEIIPIHFFRLKGKIYLEQTDISELIRDFAATEMTETRNRLLELALEIDKIGKPEKNDLTFSSR
jgi:hypothetical protein